MSKIKVQKTAYETTGSPIKGQVKRKNTSENGGTLLTNCYRPRFYHTLSRITKEWRQNWARLIQKIYEVDPLICPKCQGEMRIIAFIEDDQIIKKILDHLGLWETRNHGPPARNPTHIPELTYDEDYSQIPAVDYWLQ